MANPNTGSGEKREGEGVGGGKEKRWEKGRKKGREEGLILWPQEMVVEALEEKFRVIEESLSQRIKEINDRNLLKRLLRLSFRVNSPKEILREIETKKN